MTGFEAHHTILIVLQVFTFSLLSVLVYFAYQRKQARRHEFSKQFLEKLSSEEFVALLESSAGRRSVERVLGTYKSAEEWTTEAIRRSVVLIFGGLGSVAVYLLEEFSGHQAFLAVGSISIAGALGYLVAAALTRGRARREDSETAL